MWNVKTKVIPVIIGATGTILKTFIIVIIIIIITYLLTYLNYTCALFQNRAQ